MSELRTLPAWLDAGAAALSGAAPPAPTLEGALPGLARAQSLTPLQRLQRVQQSGLAECGGAGEPIHLAWRQFLRGRGPSVLVIDATGFDARARGSAAVLDGAPWRLAEGVLIAVGLRDSRKVELRLPAELNGREAAFLNAADAIRTLAQVATPAPAGRGAAQQPAELLGEGRPADASRLVHTPETWCRIALLFADAPDLDASLLTLRRGLEQRGLVELRPSREPPAPDRRVGRRRRGAGRGCRARLRRRDGRLPAALRLGSRVPTRCLSRRRASSRRRPP